MLLIGFLISLYIAYGAEQRGALTTAGAAWAVVVGTIIFGLGGGVPLVGDQVDLEITMAFEKKG